MSELKLVQYHELADEVKILIDSLNAHQGIFTETLFTIIHEFIRVRVAKIEA